MSERMFQQSDDISILSSEYISELTCDKCSEDGYSIENLLPSSDHVSRTKNSATTSSQFYSSSADGFQHRPNSGFMAASFVRSPITVTWRFHRPINIYAIHLGLTVSNQRTTGIQVFVGNDDSNSTDIQRRVALAYFPNSTEISECVFSRRNLLNNGMDRNGRMEIVNFTKCYLLDGVKSLSMKIVKSYYVPCLSFARLYVKGLPQPNLAREPETSTNFDQSQEHTEMGNIPTEAGMVMIPEEFLDPLTNCCMSLPVLLPSGHTVDRSTLDRFIEEEAKFGRQPNDPFTGVRFTDTILPVPNGKLKERMDKFFVTYPYLAKEQDYGRTVCGGEYSAISSNQRNMANFMKGRKFGSTRSDRTERTKGESSEAACSEGRNGKPEYLRNLLDGLPSFL